MVITKINLEEKYITKVTIYKKRCYKSEMFFLSLSITNFLFEFSESIYILRSLIFFNYQLATPKFFTIYILLFVMMLLKPYTIIIAICVYHPKRLCAIYYRLKSDKLPLWFCLQFAISPSSLLFFRDSTPSTAAWRVTISTQPTILSVLLPWLWWNSFHCDVSILQ
jgi:hypothetical protein